MRRPPDVPRTKPGLSPSRLVLAASLMALSGCRDAAATDVQKAESLGALEQSSAIAGRDGGRSFLAWGRSIWLYGDTVLFVPDEHGLQWHHNSVSITEDLDPSDGISGFTEPLDPAGAPAHVLAPTAEELAFNLAHQGEACEAPCGARWAVWPGDGVYDAARDRALILYELVYAEPGDFAFRSVGSSVALWESLDATPERPVIDPSQPHPTLLFGEDEPGFLNGAVIVEDHLHAFACPQEGFEHPCVLGRAPAGQVTDRAAWTFWDGEGWRSDWRDAEPLFDGAPILSVAWNDHVGQYLALYSEPLTDRVKLRTAPRLTGPWSYEERVFTAHRRVSEGNVYDAVLHPEYSEQGGRVLHVTHTRLTGVGFLESETILWRVTLR